jgi:hypothetical protein
MKRKNLKITIILAFLIPMFFSCGEELLQEDPKGQLSSANIASESTLQAVLYAAYEHSQNDPFNGWLGHYAWCTDEMWEYGGHLEGKAQPFLSFSWNPLTPRVGWPWNGYYTGIRDANSVLDYVDELDNENLKNMWKAEARFLRAWCYTDLYSLYGPVPLVKTNDRDEFEIPRASDDEMRSFIEAELRAAAENLPESQDEFGRATKGSALAVLCKFLLNTRQWEKSAQVAQEIIDMGIYELYPDYAELFMPSSEPNRGEFLWLFNKSITASSNASMGCAYPPGYPTNQMIWACNYGVYADFYESFYPDDKRKELIIPKYYNTNLEDTVNLLEQTEEFGGPRVFKYRDPNGVGVSHGNDIPSVRYADILLSRAEALNRMNGPNQESIDLINEVRDRAGITNLELSQFASKQALNDTILQERKWEFYFEMKRREDLLRHDKFISSAQARGIGGAEERDVLFPLPQDAMDANPELEQNEGY